MKITFLTPNLEFHGGNLVMLRYATFLADNGHEITIISSDRRTLTNIDPRIKLRLFKSFPIRYVDFFLIQKIYYSKIFKLVSECDLLIPIYTPILPAVIIAKKKKALKAKVVLLFQDCFEMVWAGPWIRKILSDKENMRFVASAICVSSGAQKQLKSVSNIKSTVITNGIDADFYDRHLKKEKYLLFVGRPQKPKGFPIFKQAYKIARREHPELRAKVVAPTVKNKEVDGIEFIQYKNRQQLAEIYNKAAIYVNTSLGESFGLTGLEAMASGTAVVITDTVGAKTYASNLENCLVTKIGSATATAAGIVKLLENKKLAIDVVKGGLLTAQKYQWKDSLEKFLKFLTHSASA